MKFPEEARGWILLHKPQLSEEQQAVVLARAQGSLKRQDISVALRSCYPDLILRSKKLNAVHLADDYGGDVDLAEDAEETEPDDFQDVEALLSEYGAQSSSGPETAFEETEAAEGWPCLGKRSGKNASKDPQIRSSQGSKALPQDRGERAQKSHQVPSVWTSRTLVA